MTYAERAYFENDHCHHVAAREEHLRIRNISRKARRFLTSLRR